MRAVEVSMKRLCLAAAVLVLAPVALAPVALAQVPVLPEEPYPEQATVVRAEAKAKAASVACESELKAGRSGPACARYHAAVLDALEREHKRFAWCNPRMSETTGVPVPKACFATDNGMRIPEVIGLERKVAPKSWKAFDDQMAKWSN
jgi:hypothetical protein